MSLTDGFSEPSSDQTKEMAYEALNEVTVTYHTSCHEWCVLTTVVTEQNEFDMMKHGNKVYMRAVTQEDPLPEVVARTVDNMVELTSRREDHQLAVLFEYLVVKNSDSAPPESMAFNNRGTHQNVLGLCVWHEGTPENQVLGRELCHSLTDVVAYSQSDVAVSLDRSYGNHGAECLFHESFVPSGSYASHIYRE